MFINSKKRTKNRYSGSDVSPWRIITHSGTELGRTENHKDKETGEVSKVFVTRWSGYKAANAVAQSLGGVAVRA